MKNPLLGTECLALSLFALLAEGGVVGRLLRRHLALLQQLHVIIQLPPRVVYFLLLVSVLLFQLIKLSVQLQ